MSDYSRAVASATRLIAAKGRRAFLTLCEDSNPVSTVKPWRGVGNATPSVEAHVVLTGVRKGDQVSKGGTSQASDGVVQEVAVLLMSTDGLPRDPRVGDLVVVDDEPAWRVVGVGRVSPDGTVIVYKVEVVR